MEVSMKTWVNVKIPDDLMMFGEKMSCRVEEPEYMPQDSTWVLRGVDLTEEYDDTSAAEFDDYTLYDSYSDEDVTIAFSNKFWPDGINVRLWWEGYEYCTDMIKPDELCEKLQGFADTCEKFIKTYRRTHSKEE